MQNAAAGLQFEEAGKIKNRLDQLSPLGKGAFRHAGQLQEFVFVALQRGPRDQTAKVFLITPGRIEELAGLVQEPLRASELLEHALFAAARGRDAPLDTAGVERIGLVSHHLFLPKQSQGVFIKLEELDAKSLLKGWRQLQNQKAPEESDGEGVVKELQAL